MLIENQARVAVGQWVKGTGQKSPSRPAGFVFFNIKIKDLVNYYLLNLISLLFNFQMHLTFFILDEKLPFYSSFKYES